MILMIISFVNDSNVNLIEIVIREIPEKVILK